MRGEHSGAADAIKKRPTVKVSLFITQWLLHEFEEYCLGIVSLPRSKLEDPCVSSVPVLVDDGDRPYDDTDKFPPEFYKIIDGVVYHKAYDSETKKHYYEITDYFATEELAQKATEITNLRSEIDGIPVTELRFYENNNKKTYPNIKKVVLPDSLKVIGEEALWSFSGIKELKIPDSVEKIERAAFARMSSLEKIALPSKVTYISKNLFSGCEKLSKVHHYLLRYYRLYHSLWKSMIRQRS